MKNVTFENIISTAIQKKIMKIGRALFSLSFPQFEKHDF